ncbi:uncharacterized protein LOC141851950 [Brevipalpus obovatus]|uniref:uncharacterized protein LOC141851950 n=1 Tax=Brevipalpus obovatus TaxID=246614 RepID=UPI003D9DED2B
MDTSSSAASPLSTIIKMDEMPYLVMENIFSHLSLTDKFQCIEVSENLRNFSKNVLKRQAILDLCRGKLDELYRCPDPNHRPTLYDRLSCDIAFGDPPESGLYVAQMCPNASVLHIDSISQVSHEYEPLEALISNLDSLVCVHLPYFGIQEYAVEVITTIMCHHSKSLRHLLVKDELDEQMLETIAKTFENLEFLALHHPTTQREGYQNWPEELGPKFSGLHIDTNFNDSLAQRILKSLIARPSIGLINEIVLTTTTSTIFERICQHMSGLQKMVIYSDKFNFPENHNLVNLRALRLSTNTDEDDSRPLLLFLARIHDLRHLVLENFELTPYFLKNLPSAVPNLRKLSLFDAFRQRPISLTGDDIIHLQKLKFLETINLEFDSIEINPFQLSKVIEGWPDTLQWAKISPFHNLKIDHEHQKLVSILENMSKRKNYLDDLIQGTFCKGNKRIDFNLKGRQIEIKNANCPSTENISNNNILSL